MEMMIFLTAEVQKGGSGGLPLGWLIAAIAAFAVLVGATVAYILLGRKKDPVKAPETIGNVPSTSILDPNDYDPVPLPSRNGILIGKEQAQGSRKDQQDSFGTSNDSPEAIGRKGLLAVVADGMGGLNNGAVYSSTAVSAALNSFEKEAPEKDDAATLLRVLKRAREAVLKTGLQDGGTTFIATLIHDRKLHFVSVGDSRICLMRNGGLIQLNREHVYGRELDELAMTGLLTDAEAARDRQRLALTSYLGKQSEMLIDRNINPIPLYSGDKVILMSDGIFGYMPEEELTRLLHQSPAEAARLVKNALIAKGRANQDNFTIVVLEIE